MTVQTCLLTDTRNPIDKPKWLWVWPTQDFTDSDGVGWSSQAKSTFNYTNNSLGSDAKVPRKDSNGNVVYWKLRRVMGSGTKSWPDDLSDPTAGVALDATTAALDDIAPVPGTPHSSVPIVTRALLNGVEIDPDVEGVLNLGTLATATALSTETSRATAAEAANAAAITSEASTRATADTSEASTRAAADTTNANAISTETTRATAAEALKAPLASPALTGTPTAPTASPATATTQVATTAYADTAVATALSTATGRALVYSLIMEG